MASDPPLPEKDLHAYVDGELDEHKHQSVARQLLTSVDCASKVAAWQEQNRAIRAAFSGVVSESIPPSMAFDHAVEAGNRPPMSGLIGAGFVLGVLTAACVMAAYTPLLSAFFTPSASGIDGEKDPARRTVAALESFTHSLEDTPQKTAGGTKPPLILPSLAPEGFVLAGVRIFENAPSNMACLFYRQPRLSPLALCVQAAAGNDSIIRATGSFPNAAVYWRQKGAAYALSGPLADFDLRHLAEAIAPEIDSFDPQPKHALGQ